MQYRLMKGCISTFSGSFKTVWNVVAPDGFIVETFSLKRDAQAWMKSINNHQTQEAL